MFYSRFQKFAFTGLTAAGGIALNAITITDHPPKNITFVNGPPSSLFRTRVVHNSWTTNTNPSVKWDYNWDHREPTSIVKPSNGTPEDDNRYNEDLEKATPTAIRHVFLIRHGQYNLSGKTDKERILSELGRKQAELTGKRLKELGHKWDTLIKSTMTRAQETADIIAKELLDDPECRTLNCSLLEEGAPAIPEPPVGHWKPEPYFYQEGARIEAAFRKYIHRAHPSQKNDSYHLVVCHANVIRYFICRAMQFPAEAWLRISLNHASITWISINPNGRVTLRCLGDTGHMEPKYITNR